MKNVLFLLLFLFLLCGCDWQRRQPSSTGQPFEVVLEGDTDSVVTKLLTVDVPALPQSEPMFNLIQVRKGKASSLYQAIRNRVVVDVDGRHAGFGVEVVRNVYASPQCVISIKAQTLEQLKHRLNGEKLRRLLERSELQYLASITRQNPEKQKEVRRLFGVDMKVPLDMGASKKGKNFVWYSNNANTGMQNLLVFKASEKADIDSVLKKNILGETDDMYMQLYSLEHNAMQKNTLQGLWEMMGDAMGGPYVMKILPRGHEQVVIIGFVYAPEMKKRNLTKQLEAVLMTARVVSNGVKTADN